MTTTKTWPSCASKIILLIHTHHELETAVSKLGLYSLSGKTSYRKISWSLEAARFGFKLFQSLWNLAGTSAAAAAAEVPVKFQSDTTIARAGVKYVLSNTNTFFSGVSNTNTNTNTPAKIWSNTNTYTAHQIQIQIQIHNETKLPPFYRWHIEIYCIVRRLFIHSNFTENCFQRSNLQ